MRLFALGELEPPDPPPPGARARRHGRTTSTLAMRWFDAFSEELGLPSGCRSRACGSRSRTGCCGCGRTRPAQPVALALRTPAAAGVARINCVYTPPEQRGRRFGGAVTAACSADALARDAERVVLFTDADNPAPNKVYQRIGFRPVGRPPGRAVQVVTRELVMRALRAAVRLRRRRRRVLVRRAWSSTASPPAGYDDCLCPDCLVQAAPEAAGALDVRTQRPHPAGELGV